MKKTVISILALATAASPAVAEELSFSTSLAFESRYVFRGIEFAESSVQPAVDIAYGNWYVGAWASLPIGDDDVAFGDELDLYAGYSASLSETVSFDVGVTYYTFPDAQSGFFDTFSESSGSGANTVEVFAGLSFDTFLAPSLYVYRDFNFNTVTLEGSGGYSFPLSEVTSFDLGGSIGYVIDDDAGGDYVYGAATADVSYALSDDAAISAGVRYGGSDIAGGSLIDDSILGTTKSSGFWYGLSIGGSF